MVIDFGLINEMIIISTVTIFHSKNININEKDSWLDGIDYIWRYSFWLYNSIYNNKFFKPIETLQKVQIY